MISRDGDILTVSLVVEGSSQTRCLERPHYGQKYTIPKSFREGSEQNQKSDLPVNPIAEIDNRAIVGILSRSIVIESLGDNPQDPFPTPQECQVDKSSPKCYFGGHVMARQGFAKFEMQGVELKNLGQGGRMGHYPLHFHLAKDTDYTTAFVKDSSVWASMNRFAVIHASSNIVLQRNVGAFSVGHGYASGIISFLYINIAGATSAVNGVVKV